MAQNGEMEADAAEKSQWSVYAVGSFWTHELSVYVLQY
jgi:hypothetical protein